MVSEQSIFECDRLLRVEHHSTSNQQIKISQRDISLGRYRGGIRQYGQGRIAECQCFR